MAEKSGYLVLCLVRDEIGPIHVVYVRIDEPTEIELKQVEGYSGSGTIFFKGSLYVIGGEIETPYRVLEIDLFSGRRRQLKDLGTSRGWSHQVVAEADDLFVIGGYDYGYGHYNTCEVFHTKQNRWEYIPSMLIGGCSFSSVILPDGRIFSVGGNKHNWRSVEMLNFERSRWREVAPMRIPRRNHATVAFRGHILAVGGTYVVDRPPRDTAEMFSLPAIDSDSEMGQWTVIASLTRVMKTLTMLVISDNELVAFGSKGQIEIFKNKSNTCSPINSNTFDGWEWENAGKLQKWTYKISKACKF